MKHKAWIGDSVLLQIAADAVRWFPSETGGTLLGYWVRPNEVVITRCTGAGPYARHTATLYVPDAEHDDRAVAAHYHESGRLHTYLGDWHTHPRHTAYLSTKDGHALHQIALEPAARTGTPLMLIAGGGPKEWSPKLWCYRRWLGRRRFVQMEFETFS